MTVAGEVEVKKGGEYRGCMGVGKLFGELAILYNCARTATIQALCDTKVPRFFIRLLAAHLFCMCLGVDTGSQCLPGHYDEHRDHPASRVPQLPQEVCSAMCLRAIMLYAFFIIAIILCVCSVPELKCLTDKDLTKIADILQEVCILA